MITLAALNVKPSDVTVSLMGSIWQSCEKEWVAENIVKLSRFQNDDEWRPFTWEDYEKFCSYRCSYVDRGVLNELAETGYLEVADDIFHFTPKIIGVYIQHAGEK